MKLSVFLIGLFVTSVTLGIGGYIFLASDIVSTKTYTLFATVDNASGLLANSDIRVAGVKVGRVKSISLVGSKAELELELDQKIAVTEKDVLKRVTQGILGAAFLEIAPSGEGKVLTNKSYISNVETNSLMDKLSQSSEGILGDVGSISTNIESYLATSDILSRIDAIALELERTITNIRVMTDDLSVQSQFNTQNIGAIVATLASITDTLDRFISYDKSNYNQEFSDTLVAIRNSLQNIQDITKNISNGEGTVGKLLADETLYNEATSAIKNINSVTNRAAGLYTDFDYRYEGLISETGEYTSRNNINLRISPPDSPRFYQVGLSMGGPEKFTGAPKYTANIGDSTLKLNLMLAQKFTSFLTVRGGLIENTGGFGVDFFPFPQWQISTEAFDFGGGNSGAMLRANTYVYPFFDPSERNNPLKWLYLGLGADDLLDSYSRNYSFGVGVRITDDFIYDTVRLIPLASSVSSVAK